MARPTMGEGVSMARARKEPPPKPEEPTTPPSPSGSERAAESTASRAGPLELEADRFEPGESPGLPASDADLDYEPPAPELIEWTPERAGAIVRAGGFMLHTADPLSNEPEGETLWRATESDVEAIASPLSRILNRYAPARRLAGVSDEAELAFGMLGYAKRNLADRGRALKAKRERDEAAGSPEWPEQPGDTTG